MNPEAYRALAERESTYWWHRARRFMARSLLRRYGLPTNCAWLDLGCGPGGNLQMLDALQPDVVAGMDVSPIALDFARRKAPHAALVLGDINERLPYDDGTFDVVTIFNVLYHDWIRSEEAVFAEVARVLRPHGLLLFTEPAFSFLEREMDEAVMTRRRYHEVDFDAWLSNAGLKKLFNSYFTSFGVPILLAARAFKRLRPARGPSQRSFDMRPLNGPINTLFLLAATLESWAIARGLHIPLGTTIVCVARRDREAL